MSTSQLLAVVLINRGFICYESNEKKCFFDFITSIDKIFVELGGIEPPCNADEQASLHV